MKLKGVILTLILCCSMVMSVNASENENSFEINLSELIETRDVNNVGTRNANVYYPVEMELDNDITAKLLIECNINSADKRSVRSTETVNVSATGGYYKTSDGSRVSYFGLAASFECNVGNSVNRTGTSAYHDVVNTAYSGTYSRSYSDETTYASVDCDYEIKKGSYQNNANIEIKCYRSGNAYVYGNYANKNID